MNQIHTARLRKGKQSGVEMSQSMIKALKELENEGRGEEMMAGRMLQLLPAELHGEWHELMSRMSSTHAASDKTASDEQNPMLPRNLMALYLAPLRKEAAHGVPTCDLQIRSYDVRNLQFFADFAMRAAYYCNLPAFGPVPLPKIIERWTVPKAQFVHKKKQENFERITRRRLIQIKDGHPASVQLWLSFLKKHAVYGIGMKANVWEFSELDVGRKMDESMLQLNDAWAHVGRDASRPSDLNSENILDLVNRENQKRAAGYNAPMMNEKYSAL